MVAIIPAAGRGTRMESVTGGAPKELLRLGSKPVLLRVLMEAREADPGEIIVVSSEAKAEMNEAIEQWSQSYFADIPIRIVMQTRLDGLAGAVAIAEVEDDAIIMVGDCVFEDESPVARMANLIIRGMDAVVAVETVPDALVSRYGIVEVDEIFGSVQRILEKPDLSDTSSRWAVAGRFGFAAAEMVFLNDFVMNTNKVNGEITLTDVLTDAVARRHDVRAVPIQPGKGRIDCGSPSEYEAARRLFWD